MNRSRLKVIYFIVTPKEISQLELFLKKVKRAK